MTESGGTAQIRGLGAEELAGLLIELRERWRSPGDRIGPEELDQWSLETALPAKHLREALRRAFSPFTKPSIRRLVRIGTQQNALGSPDPNPKWLLAILAGSIPAIAVNTVFWSLAARIPVVLKPSPGLKTFTGRLASTANEVFGAHGRPVSLIDLRSGDDALLAHVTSAPVCLVYGSDNTFGQVFQARSGLPTFGGGHRESFAVVYAEILEAGAVNGIARGIARDCAVYDQGGCLSPHAVLVETGGGVSPSNLAHRIFQELLALERRLPRGPLSLEDAARLRIFREDRQFSVTGAGAVLSSPQALTPLVVYTPEGQYVPGPGQRVLQVFPFTGTPDLRRLLPSMAGCVQGIAVAGDRRRLVDAMKAHPAHATLHVCTTGRLQRPPAVWPENGIVLTRELARLSHRP